MRQLAGVVVAVALAGSADAAVVLDFESLRVEDNQLHDHAGILEFQGFRLTSVPPPQNAFRFVSAGTLHTLFAGSTALWNGQGEAESILTAVDGGAFALLAMDLAAIAPGANDPEGPFDPGPFEFTFTGTTAGGETVSNTFTVNHTFLEFETVHFTGFGNVVAVSWFNGRGWNPPTPPVPGDTSAQFDNIVLGNSVPEPSSLVVFLAAAVCVCRRMCIEVAGGRA
ncbi:MAG: hypothetical protein ACT4QC_21245 [Planctomycetaceae bacterium]